MCDEDTERDNASTLAQRLLHRREVGVGAGAMVAALLTGCGPSPAGPQEPAVTPVPPPTPTEPGTATTPATTTPATTGRMVTIDTPDGAAEAFFAAPDIGQHPGVIVWPDVAGLREAFTTMATRLAAQGYAVLAVNPYYRASKMPVLTNFSEWQTDAGKAKIGPMREALTAEAVASDGVAFVDWLDRQPQVDPSRKVATSGYCMGGPFTFRTAAAASTRVGAIASFHGAGLVTDAPDSPHTLLSQMKAAALICIAHNDDERQPEAKSTLQQAAQAAQRPAEIEVYPAQHGWCVTDSPVYDAAQAERAWTRMLATFAAHL